MSTRILIMAGGRDAEGVERPYTKYGLGLEQATEVAPGMATRIGAKR